MNVSPNNTRLPQTRSPGARRVPLDEPGRGTCCITFRDICELPKEQIFTTHDGKNYDRLALKLWLQTSQVMPHSNTPSPIDSMALREDAQRRAATAQTAECSIGLLLGCTGLLCFGAQVVLAAVITCERVKTSRPQNNTHMHFGRLEFVDNNAAESGSSEQQIMSMLFVGCMSSMFLFTGSMIFSRHRKNLGQLFDVFSDAT